MAGVEEIPDNPEEEDEQLGGPLAGWLVLYKCFMCGWLFYGAVVVFEVSRVTFVKLKVYAMFYAWLVDLWCCIEGCITIICMGIETYVRAVLIICMGMHQCIRIRRL